MTQQDIINAVCATFQESWQDIIAKGRLRRFTEPRMIAAYLLKQELRMAVNDIAEIIDRHPSIMPHYLRTVKARIEYPLNSDEQFLSRVGLVIFHLKMKAA